MVDFKFADPEKVILTDCDGVLLDWEYSFSQWMHSKGYKAVEDYKDIYKINERYDMSREESKPLVRHFNESAWMESLPPLRDAVKYVRLLHEQHGYVFHCITSMSDDEKAIELRRRNLDNVFGKGIFEVLTSLDCGEDKDAALNEYRDSECWWIEDKPENVELGCRLNLRSILLDHRYNREYTWCRRATDWRDIYYSITGE